MFKLSIMFDPTRHEGTIIKERPNEFKLPPYGNSTVEEFDPNVHLELEPEKKKKENGDDASDDEDEEDQQPQVDAYGKEIPKEPKVWRLNAIELYHNWLYIGPDKKMVLTKLQETLTNGLESLMVFERWSKHDDLTPYANALEEWDDMVGDDWEAPDKNFLNPHDWIKEDETYKASNPKLEEIIHSAFSKADSFLRSMQPYLSTYWNNNRINFDLLLHERLRQPTDMLIFITRMFKLQKEQFETIP
jgi:hypothetical protein